MKAQALSVFVCAGLVGSAVGGETPTKVDPSIGQVKHVAHMYYNIATGEKITTLLGQDGVQSQADGEAGTEIWIADTGAQCEIFGDTTSHFWAIDQVCTSGCSTSFRPPEWFFDWGDIAMDTVVDCVQIHWITNLADTDTDLDGNADGVPGFAGNWTYYDAMNGRGPEFQSINAPLINIGFFNLPGSLDSSTAGVFPLFLYTADVDLGASGTFGTSLIFEIGDTDSDLQGAAVHNANLDESFTGFPGIPDIDPDGDGLADWGWSLTFNLPGTADVDSDTTTGDANGIDGDPLNTGTTGVAFGSPTPGHPEYDSIEGTWDWVSDGPTAGETEDVFNTGTFNSVTDSIVFDGPWYFGGLSCTLPGVPDSGYTPAAHFQTVLYGPEEDLDHSCIDLNHDGVFDFFDIVIFISERIDFNQDTVFDFFDISAFFQVVYNGCP